LLVLIILEIPLSHAHRVKSAASYQSDLSQKLGNRSTRRIAAAGPSKWIYTDAGV
jgi:hypothetical protein